MREGIKFPPIEKEWEKKGHTFQEATAHMGNVGVLAGGKYLGLDKDDPSSFIGLVLPPTTLWETRPGRTGQWHKCNDHTPEVLAKYGFKADQAQIYLYDPKKIVERDQKGRDIFKAVGEIKLERTYQVIPPSHKFIAPATGKDAPPGQGDRVDYRILSELPPAEISLDKLLISILEIGLSFDEKSESKAKRNLEKNALKLEQDKTDKSKIRYAEKVLASTIGKISTAKEGHRNKTLNDNAYLLGGYIASGYLDENRVRRELIDAAKSCGFRDIDYILGVIESAIPAGKAKPITIPYIASKDEGKGETATPEEISEDELDAYSPPDGPKFECKLPKDHFIQRFMAHGAEISDAYSEFWFAGGIHALSVIADKKIKLEMRHDKQYTNLYIAIIGKSSLSRKSTVVNKTEEMVCSVMPYLNMAAVPTEFSPEAFTEHLSNFNHAPWIRDEAAGVLSLMKRDYMRGFKDSLMQLYDCKLFYRKLRTSQRKGQTDFRVDDPYLNVLFATTDASLGANTELNDTLSGFLARFLFFFPQGKKAKWLPLEEGTAANSIFEAVVRKQLSGIADKMKDLPECTAMHISPEAARYYTEWQRLREEEWTATNDGFCMQIYSRLAPTVTKLAVLFELGSPDFDVAKPIRLEYMEEACRLVDSYFMPTARTIYDLVGSNLEKNVIDRIIAYLKNHGGKATKKEIMRDIKIKSNDFQDYLNTMIESEIVETKLVRREGKGRDSLYVFLLPHTKVGNVGNVGNVAKIAKVEEIHSKKSVDGKFSTLATLATMPTLPTSAPLEEKEDAGPSIGPNPRRDAPTDPGRAKFRAGMKRRHCLRCGRDFSYDLGIHYLDGYICTSCSMGQTEAPVKPNPQTVLCVEEST